MEVGELSTCSPVVPVGSGRRGAGLVGGPYDSPRRSQDERVLDRFERHTAFVQSGRE
jgi:hypothetical protein